MTECFTIPTILRHLQQVPEYMLVVLINPWLKLVEQVPLIVKIHQLCHNLHPLQGRFTMHTQISLVVNMVTSLTNFLHLTLITPHLKQANGSMDRQRVKSYKQENLKIGGSLTSLNLSIEHYQTLPSLNSSTKYIFKI